MIGFEDKELTVSEYLNLINETLGLIPSEQVKIVGEISDFRISQGKWVNFALKDEEQDAKVSCFTVANKLHVPLESGMKIAIIGKPKVYERFGRFSVTVQRYELVGEGALAKAYAALKEKLTKEGLFDASRKRSLPRFPERIGLITSGEAAAYGDFMRILNNRFGGMEVLHAPVHVQGQHAVNDILEAFASFNRMPEAERPEVLVLTRGGGSLEDLHAFNDEQVARAVYASKIPVIVAVGHERDESLADFAADVRASTPSNAAELIVPARRDIEMELYRHIEFMQSQIEYTLERRRRSVDASVNLLEKTITNYVHSISLIVERFTYAFERFRVSLVQTRTHIEQSTRQLLRRVQVELDQRNEAVKALERFLRQQDVHHMLRRGYSLIRKDGQLISSTDAFAKGDMLQLQLASGNADAEIQNIYGNEKET
jgi:exodeoxyribonuclease VII large subunit